MADRRKRRSKLDPYRAQIGKVADRVIAEQAGVSPDAVRMFRQRHNIPSLRAYRKSQAHALESAPQAGPAGSGGTATVPPLSGTPSRRREDGAASERSGEDPGDEEAKDR